jgi:small conductance mechanosensitive channel
MNNLEIFGKFLDLVFYEGPRILKAATLLFGGFWVIGKLMFFLRAAMDKSGLDRDLRPFLVSMANVVTKVLLLLSVAEMVGIKTTSFMTILASAAFAIGLALQGSLSNFAAGVMVLIFKPYRVGDKVSIQGQNGTVSEVQIFHTVIVNSQKKTIIIPNATAVNGIIANSTTNKILETDIIIPVHYGTNFEMLCSIIEREIDATEKIENKASSKTKFVKFENGGYTISVQVQVIAANHDDVVADLSKNIYNALMRSKIELGFSNN